MLQPLVENAIMHGFENYEKNAPCTIRLDVWIEKDQAKLHIRVVDNGVGIDAEDLARIRERMSSEQFSREKYHIALNNIHRRLKIIYGKDGRMDIQAVKGYYTRIDLLIPLYQK